jgi:DNA-binding transcriptional ArsR family regulator
VIPDSPPPGGGSPALGGGSPAPGGGSPAPGGDPFEALGDPNRRAILQLLGTGERSVGQLADGLPISRPAVSRHLRLLKDAGLVVEEARGTRRIYRLELRGVQAVDAYLTQVWGEAVTRFRLLAENTGPAAPGPGGRPVASRAATSGEAASAAGAGRRRRPA